MKSTSGPGFTFDWGQYRFDKEIIPDEASKLKSPGVIRVSGANDEDWYDSICDIRDAESFDKTAFVSSSGYGDGSYV